MQLHLLRNLNSLSFLCKLLYHSHTSPSRSSVFYSVLQLCDRAKVKLKPFFLKVHFHSMAKRKISVKNFANHSPPPQAELVTTHSQASSGPLEGRTTTACCTFPYTRKASSSAHSLCLSRAFSVYAAHKEKNLKKQNKSKARKGTRKKGYTRSGATPKTAPAARLLLLLQQQFILCREKRKAKGQTDGEGDGARRTACFACLRFSADFSRSLGRKFEFELIFNGLSIEKK